MHHWLTALRHNAAAQGEAVAFRVLDKSGEVAQALNFAEFQQQVETLARVLQAQYPPATRLLLLYEPGLDFCLAFWACLVAGVTAVPVYPPADPRTRERFFTLAKDAEASGVLTTAKIHKQISLARWVLPSLRKFKWHASDQLISQTRYTPHDFAPPAPESLALLQYTSGSTHQPKGVMLSHQSLRANLNCLSEARLQGREQVLEKFVCWLPLYHDMGLVSGVIYPLMQNAPSTLLSPLYFLQKPLRWLKAISDTQATLSCAPNFAYELCLKRFKPEQMQGLDLSSWQIALNGAEPIRASTLRRFAEAFAPWGFQAGTLYPSYGLAESTVFVAGGLPGQPPVIESFSQQGLQRHRALPPQHPEDSVELVAVGRTWGDTRYQIADPESGDLLLPGQIGEIQLSGQSLGQGYWHLPAATEAAFYTDTQGLRWLRTGDLGFVKDNQLFVTGRLKDLIILQGENYYCHSFESLAEGAHPDLRQGCVAAFGVGEPEQVVIVQEVRADSKALVSVLADAIKAAIAESLGVPVKEVHLVQPGQVPKTSSGKIRRAQCRELLQKHKLKLYRPA